MKQLKSFAHTLIGMIPAALVIAMIVKQHTWVNAALIAGAVAWANIVGWRQGWHERADDPEKT